MAIAATVERFLTDQRIAYDAIPHRHSKDSLTTAAAAHISGDRIAKAVVLKNEQGYVVAVLPATYELKMGEVHAFTGRRHLHLASEEDLAGLFGDCEAGAVSALATAYGVDAVWDESLALTSPLYFEGGDHESLVRISTADFRKILGTSNSGMLGDPL